MPGSLRIWQNLPHLQYPFIHVLPQSFLGNRHHLAGIPHVVLATKTPSNPRTGPMSWRLTLSSCQVTPGKFCTASTIRYDDSVQREGRVAGGPAVGQVPDKDSAAAPWRFSFAATGPVFRRAGACASAALGGVASTNRSPLPIVVGPRLPETQKKASATAPEAPGAPADSVPAWPKRRGGLR